MIYCLLAVVAFVAFVFWFWSSPKGPRQLVEGCVFVTGFVCDRRLCQKRARPTLCVCVFSVATRAWAKSRPNVWPSWAITSSWVRLVVSSSCRAFFMTSMCALRVCHRLLSACNGEGNQRQQRREKAIAALVGVLTRRTTQANMTPIQLDVTSDESVKAAVGVVEKALGDKKKFPVGLIGIVNCAGVAFEGPA